MPISCLVATDRPDALADFIEGLETSGSVQATFMPDGEQTIAQIEKGAPALVVVDEGLPDFDALSLVMEIIRTNAMVQTAVITSLSAAAFHDASEGLGVLRALPVAPDASEGRQLAEIIPKNSAD